MYISFAIKLIFIDLDWFSFLKGLGIPGDQYIYSTLIHQVNDGMKSHMCSHTSEHYSVGQHTRQYQDVFLYNMQEHVNKVDGNFVIYHMCMFHPILAE